MAVGRFQPASRRATSREREKGMRRGFLTTVLAAGLIAAAAGPAQGAGIIVYPYGLAFGPQKIGTSSAPQAVSVNLSSSSGSTASFSGFQIAEPGSLCAPLCANPAPEPDFVGSTDCPMYSAYASCHIYITFRPVSPPSGTRSATLWINGGNAGYYHAPLSGTAVAPRNCKKKHKHSAASAKKKCKKNSPRGAT